MNLDFRLIAWHGGLLALAASVVIMTALRLNPRLFLRHFPVGVRKAQAPLSRGELAAGYSVGLVLVVLFVGAPIWSTQVAAQRSRDWLDLFAHAFAVGMMPNLTDWLVLDELWLGLGRPAWALPPGVPASDVPFDHGQHFRGFVTGTVLFAVVAVLAATMAWR